MSNISEEENEVDFQFICDKFLIMSSYGDFKTAIGPVGCAIKAISDSNIVEDKSFLNYFRVSRPQPEIGNEV